MAPKRRSKPATQEPASAAHQRFCDVCNCNVAGGWQVHVSGIRHRRNQLSVREYGSVGHNIVSVYESIPSSSNHVNYATHDPLAGLLQHKGNRQAQDDTNQLLQLIQTAALREIAHCTGVGNHLYRASSNRFSIPELERSHHQHTQRITDSKMTGAYVIPVHATAAEIACASHCLNPSNPQQSQITRLEIDLPLKTYGAEAIAYVSALCLVVSALQLNTHAAEVKLHIHPEDLHSILRQGGTGINKVRSLWERVLAAVNRILSHNCTIRTIDILAPPGILPADKLADMVEIAAAAPKRLRTAVLMGLHRRAGAHSQLRLLPLPVMECILDLCIPRQPCQVNHVMHTSFGASSSSSSSSSGGSSDDTSSTEGSSDEDGSSSGSDSGTDADSDQGD